MALLLLVILTPVVAALASWHYAGYVNGRYDRWSIEQESTS